MKRRLLAFLLILSLFSVPTLAMGTDVSALFPVKQTYQGFSDVPSSAWYLEHTRVCYETGLMRGTSGKTFSPGGAVTVGEIMVISARLHRILNGKDSIIPAAPAVWGTGSLTSKIGTTLLTFTSEQEGKQWYYQITPLSENAQKRELHFYLTVTPETQSALTPAGDTATPATLALNGKSVITGAIFPFSTPPNGSGLAENAPCIEFRVESTTGFHDYLLAYGAFVQSSSLWYRDAVYYLMQNKLMAAPPYQITPALPATRLDLPGWLAKVLPSQVLSPINHVTTLPDTRNTDVLALYNAGILSGTDSSGTFQGSRGLTRAELAAMMSRVVRPTLRLTFTLDTPQSFLPHTLTQLNTGNYSYCDPLTRILDADMIVTPYSMQFTPLFSKNGMKYGFMNQWGVVIAEPIYDAAEEFCADGVTAVSKNGRWGFIDTTGKEIVPCLYTAVSERHSGILLAQLGADGPYTVFDATGKQLGQFSRPGEHLMLGEFQDGLTSFVSYPMGETFGKGTEGYLNAAGDTVIPATFSAAYPFSEGYALVSQRVFGFGVINRSGLLVVPYGTYGPGESQSPWYSDGRLVLSKKTTAGTRYGAINHQGKEVVPFIYDSLEHFSDGMARFDRNGVTGYVDPNGKELVTSYSACEPFSGGYAAVTDGDGYGYIDKGGNLVLPCLFTAACPIFNGSALVTKGGALYRLDLNAV